MTRVEKYREYRKEILNSFYFENKETKKSITSKKVSDATLNKDTTNSLSYEEVLEAYELYETESKEVTKKKMSPAKKKELIFFIIGLGVIVILIVALVIVGIFAFGGK